MLRDYFGQRQYVEVSTHDRGRVQLPTIPVLINTALDLRWRRRPLCGGEFESQHICKKYS